MSVHSDLFCVVLGVCNPLDKAMTDYSRDMSVTAVVL